ncbi:MAG TPA: zinc-dependent alcohol dehydrogenase family protein [Armatimonadota bacterium]|nr:zinc-dependent alcohol dehydrogenase family protein [Armatimonadota bacterium]
MKSVVFHGKHNISIDEKPMPAINDNEVLLKVMACGVCGTDVHIYEGDEGAAKCPAGTTLGHEFSGVVEQLGKNVTGYRVGDRVCVDPNQPCGVCYYCQRGLVHFCEYMVGIGTTVDGGFAQYCAVPQSQIYPIADHTTFEQAAMAEPLSCCLHGIDLCDIKCADTVAVIGGGMIGLIMLQLAKLSGAHTTILIEPIESKREIGKKLGADICIDPFAEDVKERLARENIHRISVVIECVGSAATIKNALDIAGKKSTVMLFGLTQPQAEVPIKPFDLFKKEITIRSSFINPNTQPRAVELINTKKVDVASMIYEVCGFEELTEILQDSKRRSQGKYIVNPWKK